MLARAVVTAHECSGLLNTWSKMNLTLITFHIDTAPVGSVGSVHPNANLERWRYLRMIDLMFRSGRIHHPGCRAIILTNDETDLSPLDDKYEVWRVSAKPETLMLDRTRAMAQVIRQLPNETNALFLDSDILLNAPLESVLQESFDLAFTYRDHPRHPINGGLIFAKLSKPDRVAEFFDEVLRTYRDRYAAASSWFGDQDAILDVLGRDQVATRKNDMLTINECIVRLLPCDTYNYSPAPLRNAIRTPLRDRLVLHFKGERKPLMSMFWNAYLLLKEDRRPANWFVAADSRLRIHFGRKSLVSGR